LLHCTPSCLVDVEELGGKEVQLQLLVLAQNSLCLQSIKCRASREKLGVAGFCSVSFEMSAPLGSYGPGLGRATVKYTTTSNFALKL
jgi:hypothetical protein